MDYNRVATNVAKTIQKFGRAATLRQQSLGSGTYDPSTGMIETVAPVESTRYVVTMDQPGLRIALQFGQTLVPNSLSQKSEKWVYMDAVGPKPNFQDQVILDGLTYTIVNIQEQRPGPVPLLYLLVLRA
jgi:hypothetical protein